MKPSEKWAYLAEFTADDIEIIDEPLVAAKELLIENTALKRVGTAAKAVCDYFESFGLKREEQAIWDELENSVAELADALLTGGEDETE